MIALYCSTSGLLSRLEELIAASDYTTTDCRETLPVMLGDDATVGVVGLEDCTDRDVAWLKGVFGRCMSTPRGVVVTPLRLDVLQRLRPLGNDRFEVVWSEEADGRLPEVLREMDRDRHREPLRRLGERILSRCEIRPRLRPVIRCLCNLDRDSSPPAKKTVAELAALARVTPVTLGRFWKEQVPLKCSPKQLLSWAVLLWAVGRRAETSWDSVARRSGYHRRTLERYALNLAGVSLREGGRDPDSVRKSFEEWLADVECFDAV